MENKMSLPLQKLLQIFIICLLGFCSASVQDIKTEGNNLNDFQTYIVHVRSYDQLHSTLSDDDLKRWYSSFLSEKTTSPNGGYSSRILHSYRHAFSGFAAKLTAAEVEEMEKKDGFISAMRDKVYTLHTTHTPSFLGLHQNLGFWKDSKYGEGTIIGLLDSGITPGHPSLSDKGMPPPPSKWKGKCDAGITCNNKLIGAKNLVNSSAPPIDDFGHGTHTSSTAAGNFVNNANVFGQANGTAVGIAPRAHVAMYKVCTLIDCEGSVVLAALDAAIEDGVDVISYSLGGGTSTFDDDPLSIGAFSAITKGIFVSTSAGNEGPQNATLSNEAPWVLTTGASSTDRDIRATVVLGDKQEFDGQSMFQPKNFSSQMLPLVYPGVNDEESDASRCVLGSLNNSLVGGNIVICRSGGLMLLSEKAQTVKDAGGAAMILINAEVDGGTTQAEAHVLPASHVSYAYGKKILAYLNSTSKPTATVVFKGTVMGDKTAPAVAQFSARGPNIASPGILKPDIIGPGSSILAAWDSSIDNTNTKSTFNIISGTSMSCPHLSGIAALLKSSHPDWSPATIKSAMMTTAIVVNLNEDPILDEKMLPANVHAIGAGHVNPPKANDPGLVYDIHPDDYIHYLCGLGYTGKQIKKIMNREVNCSDATSIPEAQLNYPSFSIELGHDQKNYTRTVTNVGKAVSTYDLQTISPKGVNIEVNPTQLSFTEMNQKMMYNVTFSRSTSVINFYVEGAIIWSSGHYSVRSPVSIKLL
ncbi:serine protease [Lithospermum erythrorhizon]|uniref:Serine protease n=1 Tax=Lithospermum erythrorhizon TaxID=34254 RepID=A0AAV3QSR7_LITER